ncbi:MAG: pantoate--beta-alanine ligase [Pseudomonadota bacterium]|nr:pantoate--beta-alanine ligase [Pseudomonadota bacterium]
MDICTTSGELSLKLENWRQAGMKVGLVPTMGALHAGHLSLVEAMSAQADKIIVSLFVNPTQFAEGEDFDAYPRTTEDDLQKLLGTKANIVFMPDASEIYGEAIITSLQAGNLGDGLESKTRPHFFSGVVTVIHKLFELCQPDAAIFGEKDYQQLLVIKQMVATHDMKIKILQGPTLREADGLAMSSRNAYLTESQRKTAANLNKIMRALCEDYHTAQVLSRLPALEAQAIHKLKEAGFTEIDYITVRDSDTLKTPNLETKNLRLLAAVRLGDIRLIDNCPV